MRVKAGSPIRVVAPKYSLSVRTAYKWVARFRSEGAVGLVDRLSVPGRMPRRTPSDREAVIVLLRHYGMSGPAIARQLGMPRSTVARVLVRCRRPAPKTAEQPGQDDILLSLGHDTPRA
jgi:hypothetical protein